MSYINNLHPARYRELYKVMKVNIPSRIKYDSVDYLPDDPPEPEPEEGETYETGAFWARWEKWKESRHIELPEPAEFQPHFE
ncbi:hypothetical protein P175DRAFT_0532628 [Aspergillus ochraceoroseus IBT 24754]|uniref:Uncharacterized protein n=1 Tax=Aspergillus ochraceoroseus IBT 24754 TaxID=1392256 RepID=A0A2T5LY82_9EURO|nr:uncharacterized protein P175DRAFT_0532628 [Aspergillus ochraceoroseus IBT 24754]PTU21247.1 hypothetical protein P175DRAFT_0532628 [Aspergillus ochraceoroseus IBT 24754]